MQRKYTEFDLGCAAYLLALGHTFLGLVPLRAGRAAFEFADNGRCADNAKNYWRGGMCAAEPLLHQLLFLKKELRQYKSNLKRKDVMKNEPLRKSYRTATSR